MLINSSLLGNLTNMENYQAFINTKGKREFCPFHGFQDSLEKTIDTGKAWCYNSYHPIFQVGESKLVRGKSYEPL